MRYIASALHMAWESLIPSGDFISRFTGHNHTYCHTCDRSHTDGCHPWRS
ncbi:hypothetical protein LCGC14_1278580 [marine sediment metagenome]|uniref:Uncharacterized protein n=1 Tax=marine sediment metagenome TaxID=412755 RepID=A0A0F9NZ01_9ZZZZ